PETGDIGPKTYAKIFELLLRLKANLIWPAMHPSTKAFYHYPGNKKVAADYAIVVGSSHAEPMLRNNVGEWDKSMGDFNYITNKEKIYNYWESRVKESKGNDAIYTMGMRGVHDSGMEGVKSVAEAIPLLEKIIEEQRDMLKKHVNSNIEAIPQVFTVYKEVLDIYDRNIKLADDITVVWPDDNYGYIQRLNSEKENKRSGGSGVYYHASYWGRPHDYLWLSSTHPGLLREEMMKAYETKSDRLWVLNVGDIKPLEHNIQLFMDMAYRAEPFKESSYTKTHLKNWAGNIFGVDKAEKITGILWKYYQLAFERRPEFMGWSQTEPTTQTNYSDYNHFHYGDEAQRRIDEYEKLVAAVKILRPQINSKDADAFYQLVYYPVVGASLMTKKFLYRDKAHLYSAQNRASSKDFAALSQQAYEDIVKETEYYNTQLANGKWKYMMSMMPRDLPVYKTPELPNISIDKSRGVWDVLPEGSSISWEAVHSLPAFNPTGNKKYFIDIFTREDRILNWTAVYANWIILSQRSGSLKPETGKRQNRVWVSIDWSKVPSGNRKNGKIYFKSGDQTIEVNVGANNTSDELAAYKGYIEDNRLISIHASNFSRKTENGNRKWSIINGLGTTDNVIEALPLQGIQTPNLETLKENAPYLEYDFYNSTPAKPVFNIYTLPTHAVNPTYSMRYGISVDNGPVKIVDFKTLGRSEEWKQNILRNNAIRKVETEALSAGKHTFRIYMIDPGVILDRIIIDFGAFETKKAYSVLPETKN
ncbi:MAG: glycosyl hydrolase 115 family protein, partial [Pyrinomonadaceae bacterium]|nr:glycosyl hydrolase 115 family protein [Sphingobacteriaceae bacterium]